MALVKYGGGIVQVSGSMAGTTHARNRFGNYIRSRTKPINPKSARQMGARVAIMYLAEYWRESPMDDNKRTAWQTYANSCNWVNKLGESVTLTGFNMFIRANAAILRLGGTIVADGPTALGLPPGDPEFKVSDVNAAAQTYRVHFDPGFDWNTEDGAYLTIEQGLPQNPSRNFFAGPWRYSGNIAGVAPGGVESPVIDNPMTAWTFTTGQKIWWRAAIIRADGRMSTKFEGVPQIVIPGV